MSMVNLRNTVYTKGARENILLVFWSCKSQKYDWRILYSINIKSSFFWAKSSEAVTGETLLFIWITCSTLLCDLVLWSLVHSSSEKVVGYLTLGCRFSFTKEAPEEVERNSSLLSPSSTVSGTQPRQQESSARTLPVPFPKIFFFSSTLLLLRIWCSLGYENRLCPFLWARHCQAPALYSAPLTLPWTVQRCTERRGKADREIIQRRKLVPVLCRQRKQWCGALCSRKQIPEMWAGTESANGMCKQKLSSGGQVLQVV